MTERALVVNFLGNTAGLEAAIKRTSTSLNGMQTAGAGMRSVGASMTRNLTVPILAAGGAAVTLATKFQASTERLRTQAGATQSQVDMLRKGILAMAGSLGTSPEQLSAGMYHVVSSMNAVLKPSQRVSGELTILKDAAKLAKVGGSDLEDTTYALASAMNALHAPISQTGKVTGELNAIVGAGDMTMTDLVESFKSGLVPGAKEAGLSLQSLGAALAVMGDLGMRGSLAGTRLRMSIALLSSPSAAAAKVLDTLGMTSKQATSTSAAMAAALEKAGLRTTTLGADLRKPDGFMVALQDLNSHLRASGLTATGAAAVMSKAFGGGRMGATITLLDQNLGRLGIKFDQIGHSTKQFGADWKATTETAAFKWSAMIATVEADAIRLGNDILPTVLTIGTTVVTDVDKVAKAFTSLPKGAQDAIIKGGLVLAAIGPALKLLGVFTGGIGKLYSISTKLGTWGAASAAESKSPLAAAAMSRSVATMNVGTLIVRSSVGGVGSMPAGAGAAVAAEERSAGGVILPPGVRAAEIPVAPVIPAAEKAAVETSMSGGMMSSVKSGIGKGLSGAMRGVAIGGIGTLLSQTVGSAVHGGVGSAIKSIGTDASIGAGLGSFFGPGGIAGGAIVGGLVGTFTHVADSEGKAFADKLLGPLPAAIKQKFQKPLQNAQQAVVDRPLIQTRSEVQRRFGGATPRGAVAPGLLTPSKADLATTQAGFFNEGWVAGNATVAGAKSVKVPSTGILLGDFSMQLGKLSAQARPEGAKVMLQYAAGLVASGRLPRKAVSDMIGVLENQFPALRGYLKTQGLQTGSDFAQALKFTHATDTLKHTLAGYRSQFGDWAISTKLTAANVNQNTNTAMVDLRTIVVTSIGRTRKEAEAELSKLQAATDQRFTVMGRQVAAAAGDMHRSVADGSALAYRDGAANWQKYAASIDTAMRDGVLSARKGAKQITDALNSILRGFRELPLSSVQISHATPGQLRALASGQVSSGAVASKHAMGGLIQIGRHGEKGIDSVPLDVSGTPILVAPGEQVAVFTPGQQAFLAKRLADVGGLAGVFKHFATGGTVGRNLPHVSVSKTQIPVTPISTSPSSLAGSLANLDQAAARTTATVNALTRELAAAAKASSETAALQTKLTGLDDARQVLEDRHAAAKTAAQRKTIDGELAVNEARKQGIALQLSDARTAAAARKVALEDQLKAAKAQQTAQAKQTAAILAGLAEIPSQLVGAQIKGAQLNNRLTLAQNAAQNSGDPGGQTSALNAENRLDQQWLSADKSRLAKINKALAQRGLTRAQRGAILQDKLRILQEIGTIEGNIGSVASSLSSLTGGSGSSASTGSFDLAPGGSSITTPTAYDVSRAIGAHAAPAHVARHLVGGLGPQHAVSVEQHFHIHADSAKGAAEIKEIVKQASAKVADDLERSINSRLKARTRLTGNRGT